MEELKIKGNTFDPFSGSGTTLLASRIADLNSFGIDVNPISVLVAKVENEQYTSEDIIQIEEESKKLTDIEKSKENFQTSFNLANKVFNQEILQALLQFKQHIKAIQYEKTKEVLFVAWLSIIEDVSNIKKEGNGIKYKNRKRTPNGYINIEKRKGATPRNIVSTGTSFATPATVNMLSPIGGVISPASIISTAMTPNHMGLKPRAKMTG